MHVFVEGGGVMTTADIVIADLIEECDQLRKDLAIAMEMVSLAVHQYHYTLKTLDRVRRDRAQLVAKSGAQDTSVMLG